MHLYSQYLQWYRLRIRSKYRNVITQQPLNVISKIVQNDGNFCAIRYYNEGANPLAASGNHKNQHKGCIS